MMSMRKIFKEMTEVGTKQIDIFVNELNRNIHPIALKFYQKEHVIYRGTTSAKKVQDLEKTPFKNIV